jgi:tRNA-dihydrouridine synthase
MESEIPPMARKPVAGHRPEDPAGVAAAEPSTGPEDLLVLAPMKGYTDHVYRNVLAAHFGGIDIAVAPFVTASAASTSKRGCLRGLLPENNRRMPVVPQVLGHGVEGVVLLARMLHDMGHRTLNWNLGCPFPQVARKGKGSGMLPHPDRIDAFLDRVVPRIPIRLSVKTRLGRHRYDEIFRVIRVFNRYPLSEIIVHPRTGVQMYDGAPDLDTLETLLDMTDHRVVYNGDIRCPEDLEALRRRFPGIRGWMVGRAVLANPFLPGLLRRPDAAMPDDPALAVRDFHDELMEAYRRDLSGPGHLLDRMKGFWKYLAIPFDNAERGRKRIQRARRTGDYLLAVRRFFESEARWTGRVTAGPMQRAAR